MMEGTTGTNSKSSKREELQVSEPNSENETWFKNGQIFVAIYKSKVDKVQALQAKRGSEFALKMLFVMSHLAPDLISVKEIFEVDSNDEILETASDDEQAIRTTIELLDQYSIVQLQARKVGFLRSVQQVTRLKLEERSINGETIRIPFKLLMISFPYFSSKIEDINKKRRNLPHFEAFLLRIDDLFQNRIEERPQIEMDYLNKMLIVMADGHDLHTERMKELLERALSIIEKHFGPDHCEVVVTIFSLSIAYSYLGDVEKSKLMLERALAIQEKHFGPDYHEVAVTLVNLGTTYRVLGDTEKSKLILERALAIPENPYGSVKTLTDSSQFYNVDKANS